MVDQPSASFFSFLPLVFGYSFLSAVLKSSRSQSEVAFLCAHFRIKRLCKGHLCVLSPRVHCLSLPRLAIQCVIHSTLCFLLCYFRFNSLGLQIPFKLFNAFSNLVLSLLQLLLGLLVIFIRLGEVKLELGCLTFPLDTHVCLPILNSFRKPLLHKPSIAL